MRTPVAPRLCVIVVLLLFVLSPLASQADSGRPRDVHHEDTQQAAAGTITRDQLMAALPKLEALAMQTLESTGIPGFAIAVVFDDDVVYLDGFGVRKVGESETIDPDTVFQIASMSKPIASTVVAGLVGDGVVNWDDPIVQHDPGFEMPDPWVSREVTLRDMFAHRSGLPEHAGDLLEDVGYGRDQVLYRLRFGKTGGKFRADYAYTNFGLTEAAVAAARADGKSWEDLSEERLYEPLGMASTSSRFADYEAAANRAWTHVRVDDQWVAKYVRRPEAQSPAGGVSSTGRDLTQWLRLQLGNGTVDGREVISARALGQTHAPQIVSQMPEDPSLERAGFYGLGWNVSYDALGRVQISHSGAFAYGASTAVYLLPAENLGITVLTNGAPIGVPEGLCLSFLDLATYGEVQRDYVTLLEPLLAESMKPAYDTDYSNPPAQPSPALPLETYAGTYHNDYFGDIDIALDGNGLVIREGPNLVAFPMEHWGRDVFYYQPVGENAGGLSGVTFTVGADRRATHVVVEDLDVKGNGTFARVSK